MKSVSFSLAMVVGLTLLAGAPTSAQTVTTGSTTTVPSVSASSEAALKAAGAAGRALDAAGRAAIVEKVSAILDEYYVYPDVGEKMKQRMREQLRSGAYDKVTDGRVFGAMLTGDMISVSHDRHLGIMYNPGGGLGSAEDEMTPEEHARQNEQMRRFGDDRNWGFVKTEILPGNIGYIDLRLFGHPDWAGDSAANAMAMVAKTDALIIDLRQNGGGYPQMVAQFASYFLSRPSIHGATEQIPLFLQNDRKAGTTTQIDTLLYVPGKRYLDKPVYLLTSHRTFSGAELFADAMKTNKRATIVGETTGGGSHSMLTRPINDYFEMAVSFGWTKDAVTGFDWDDKGITPDTAVPAQTALETAHLAALKAKAQKVNDPGEKHYYRMILGDAERALAAAQPKGPLEGNTTFRLRGHKDAKSVSLAGDFNQFDFQATKMVPDGDGWIVRIDLTPGRYFYKFVVDGQWIMDPDNHEKGIDRGGFESSLRTITR